MLSECNAFIVAPSRADALQLERMAERVGFGYIATTFSPEALHFGLTFFVLHFRLERDVMRAVIAQVRHSPEDDTRYAPIVLFTDDCPVDRLLGYIQLGFDDVIALPENREVLEARLNAQLRSEHVYYETDSYLGPDRRRMELSSHHDDRRTGVTPFTTLVIRRDPTQGVRVQRRHTIGQQQRPLPNETTHYLPLRLAPGGAISRFPG